MKSFVLIDRNRYRKKYRYRKTEVQKDKTYRQKIDRKIDRVDMHKKNRQK